MIKKNELRPGNWFQYKGDYYLLEGFDNGPAFKRLGEETNNVVSFKHLKPIRLTEELIQKCGFVRMTKDKGEDTYWHRTKFDIRWRNGISIELISLPHIKFLHQLQNFYFGFSGKEMKIDLGLRAR